MIKIKENINLEELKKFNFKKAGNGEYFFENSTSLECIFIQPNKHIYIETKSIYNNVIVEELLYKLLELIKANYIEEEER